MLPAQYLTKVALPMQSGPLAQGDLAQLVLSDQIEKLLALEGCLAGNPAGDGELRRRRLRPPGATSMRTTAITAGGLNATPTPKARTSPIAWLMTRRSRRAQGSSIS